MECRNASDATHPVNQPNPLNPGSDYNDALNVR